MCGIAGFYSRSTPVDAQRLTRMMNAIRHRGPDGQGTVHAFASGGSLAVTQTQMVHAALGHVRLAVVDLSADGSEPMANEDGTLWLTYNGEIYNHATLREELRQKGHVFKSRCDAEILLHGYEAYGAAFFQRLRGMFAFGLLDLTRNALVVCRDPFGIKPLYVFHHDGVTAFASELHALEDAGFAGGVNVDALHVYLALGFIPAPLSARRDVEKLMPGACVRFDQQGRHAMAVQSPPLPPLKRPGRDRDVTATMEASLRQSVKAHLMADVEVGTFLSGGLDSALVTAAMVDEVGNNVQAFTMAVDEPGMDESEPAAHVARTLGIRHHIRRVSAQDALARLSGILGGMDEPLADASILPTRLVSELAREHVKVVLSGDGGDELLGGYTRHHLFGLLDAARPLAGLAGAGTSVLNGVGPSRLDAAYARVRGLLRLPPLHAPSRKIRAALTVLDLPRAVAYAQMWRTGFVAELLQLGITEDPALAHLTSSARGYANADALSLAQAMDLRTWLPDDILTKLDRASMAVALESRVPLIDLEVAGVAASLPLPALRKGSEGKRVLRTLAARRFGDALARAPKRGFGLPMRAWLSGALKGQREELLGSLGTRGLFPAEGLRALQDTHDAGEDHAPLLFALLALESWLRARPDRVVTG